MAGPAMRRRQLAVASLLFVAGVVLLPFAAGAQEPVPPTTASGATTTAPTTTAAAGPAIGGKLQVGTEPVEGVDITVKQGDRTVDTVTSGSDGSWEVIVPGAGVYRVEIDTESFPKNVRLLDPKRTVLPEVRVQSSGRTTVLFPFATGKEEAPPSDFVRFVNFLIGGVKFGIIIAVASVGLSLVYGTMGLTNFAQGELVTFGAITTWYLNSPSEGLGISLVPAVIISVAIGALFGMWLDRAVWRPLRTAQRFPTPLVLVVPVSLLVAWLLSAGENGIPFWAGLVIGAVASVAVGVPLDIVLKRWRPVRRVPLGAVPMMVVSIGLALLLRYVYLVIFEANPRSYAQFAAQPPLTWNGLEVTPKNLFIIVVGALVLLAVGLALTLTRFGTAIRAVSDDHDLAESSGIDRDRVIMVVWAVSVALAGLGGTFLGLTEAVQWDMGLRILLVMFAAVVLGGLGSPFGAMGGGLLVGIAHEVSAYWFPTDFKVVFALGALVLVLLFRPQGIFGLRARLA